MIEVIYPDQLGGIANNHAKLLSQVLDNPPMTRRAKSLSFHTTGTDACWFVSLQGLDGTLELLTNEIPVLVLAACITLLCLFTQHHFWSI